MPLDEAWVRSRLVLGVRGLRLLPATGCFPNGYSVPWPPMQAERYLDRAEENTPLRFLASSEEIAALDEVTPWLYRLTTIGLRKAVFLRAYHPGAGWRRIGAWLGVNHETARRWERQGIGEIVRGHHS